MNNDLENKKMFEEKISKKIRENMWAISPPRHENPSMKAIQRLSDFYFEYQKVYADCLIEVLKDYDYSEDSVIEQAVHQFIMAIQQTMEHIARDRRNSRWWRFKSWLKGQVNKI